LFLADWIVRRYGFDPASDLRGTYASEREMRHLLKARGGIVEIVNQCAARAGLQPTDHPRVGDVGLVRVCVKLWRGRGVLVPVGGVLVSRDLWAIKTREHGRVAVQPFPLMKAWGLLDASSNRRACV
jgi:Domain of unknown function (DUF6950)